jgi:hypothetical protein
LNFLFGEVFFMKPQCVTIKYSGHAEHRERGIFFFFNQTKEERKWPLLFQLNPLSRGKIPHFFFQWMKPLPVRKIRRSSIFDYADIRWSRNFNFVHRCRHETNFVKTQIDDEFQFCLKVIMKMFEFEMVDI